MSIVTYNNRSIANISAIPGAAKSLTHIKTLTASSSSTLSFVDGSDDVVLDSTYPIYLFKFINIHPGTNDTSFTFQANAAGGSGYNETITSSCFVAYHYENASTQALNYVTGGHQGQGTGFQLLGSSVGSDNDQSISGELFIFNPSSTTFVKNFTARCNSYLHSDGTYEAHIAGYFNTTSAIDEFQFKMDSGNIDAGTIKLYGIKDS